MGARRQRAASASYPAADISWADVQRLVSALNQAAGDSLYRLPTEAEWKYACRAGTANRWSFGDGGSQLGHYAWYEANAWSAGLLWAQSVETKTANPWGLYDMHGNVLQWVQDEIGGYDGTAQVDPQGPARGSDRVIRGGSFAEVSRGTRSACRLGYAPDAFDYTIGARLLRMAARPTPGARSRAATERLPGDRAVGGNWVRSGSAGPNRSRGRRP